MIKRNISSIFLAATLFSSLPLYGLETVLTLFERPWEVGQTFSQTVEKTISDLEKRKIVSQDLLGTYKAELDAAQKNVARSKGELHLVHGIERDFTGQKIDILNKTIQILSELVLVIQDIQDIKTLHIKMLEEYKEDPEFTKKGFQLEPKSIYSIEDFQKITSLVIRFDNELKILRDRLEKSTTDSQSLRETLRLVTQELNEKQQEQADIKEQVPDIRLERKKFSLKQRGTLLDLEERQLSFQQALAEAHSAKADAQAQLMELEIRLTTLKLDLLKKQEDQVRRELRIDRKDIDSAEAELKKQIEESTEAQKKLNERIEGITRQSQEIREKIDALKKKYSLTDIQLEELSSWSDTPVTQSQWRILIEVGRQHNNTAYDIEVLREILLAQIALEKAKVTRQEVENMVITSWNSLTTGVFDGAPDLLSKEIKKYEKMQSDLFNSVASLADRRDAASKLLADTARINQAVKERFKALVEQKNTTFQSNPTLYTQLEEILKAEDTVEAQKRGEYIAQLLELYASISQLRMQTNQKVEMMERALQSKAQSNLVPPLWHGVKKFFPDLMRFVLFMVAPGQFQKSSMSVITSFWGWVHQLAGPAGIGLPLFLLIMMFLAVCLALIYLALRFAFRFTGHFLSQKIPPSYGIFTFLGGIGAIIVQFISEHLGSMFLWFLAFSFVSAGYVNAFSTVVFYGLSVFLWIYYVRKFVSFAQQYNLLRHYQFVSESYHERFFYVLSVLLSSTVSIFFLRHSIMTVLPQSDAPRILQALNFIIVQISLIFMISRAQIYKLIPQNTSFGKWFFEMVDNFYYLFVTGLIFIIVMSNPYIGYGSTFLYLTIRIIVIMLLIPILVAIHSKIKNILGTMFLESDEAGATTERFAYARTSYGILIILSFMFFSVLAVLFAFNIWGFSLGGRDIIGWLRKDLYGYTSPETGRRVAINSIHVARVIINILLGIGIALILTRVVLRRMFDLLLVKASVQSIILSLTRYIIVLISLLIGLSSIGFGTTWMFYLLAIVGGLGVAGKEILADFIGYFMILIQRPVKIGDYVKIDDDFSGVVRQLTLRSVILRKKNSVTLIVPNSYILGRPLTNWNYYKMYFAFEDITITVSYSADPEQVHKLFLKVLNDNREILKNPAPIVRLNNFAENGFEFLIRGYLSHEKVTDQNDIASMIRLALVKTLKEHGVKIAVPVRMLQIKEEGITPVLGKDTSKI